MDILVYDNSATAQYIPTSKWWKIHYVHNPSNPGVSKAYNMGFQVAKQLEKKWLWLLDQDTEYPSSTLDEYTKASDQHYEQEIFVPQLFDQSDLVSPFQFKNGGGKKVNIEPGVHSIRDFVFHNCGLLVSLKYFEKAGGYDEEFSLDFSDISFAKRLSKISDAFVLTTISAKHALATTSSATIHERAVRFKSYVKACRTFKRIYEPSNLFIPFRLLLRTLKLCWQYKSIQFIRIYLSR